MIKKKKKWRLLNESRQKKIKKTVCIRRLRKVHHFKIQIREKT